jgi:hypothetical protein
VYSERENWIGTVIPAGRLLVPFTITGSPFWTEWGASMLIEYAETPAERSRSAIGKRNAIRSVLI